jgi:hypothetical protein
MTHYFTINRRNVNRPIPERIARMYATKYTVDESGCWLSTYAPGSNGYISATWRADGRSTGTGAHRAAWTHHNGPIPDGMTVDHLCRKRTCVNPEHLRLLSNTDNARRQYGRDWPLGQCRNGHPDSKREEFVSKGRVRTRCRPCLDYQNSLWREKRARRGDTRYLAVAS